MRYLSTRGHSPVLLEQAIMSGTAPDGGLYVPESLPAFPEAEWPSEEGLDPDALAALLLRPFFAGSSIEHRLAEVCMSALDFPLPIRRLEGDGPGLSVLELFHGPTAAFKDVGARFLAGSMRVIEDESPEPGGHPVTILVATSGDTGGAVASAFHRLPGFRVFVLFPEGRVSPRQQHQLTCWDDNVHAVAVRGGFDDCQRLVKACFSDPGLVRRHRLCSANSINIGRLLPQMVYYARASLRHWYLSGMPSSFIIPTGNLGNGFACVWARSMGLPIDRIVLATNANTTIPDFLATGQWIPRPGTATLASAMDVGDPSNMERLRYFFPEIGTLREQVAAVPVDDEAIRATIIEEYRRHGTAWCPHTATGMHVYRELPAHERRDRHWIVAATAHAAKFDAIVEPLLGIRIEPPPELSALLRLPVRFDTVDPTPQAFRQHLESAS